MLLFAMEDGDWDIGWGLRLRLGVGADYLSLIAPAFLQTLIYIDCHRPMGSDLQLEGWYAFQPGHMQLWRFGWKISFNSIVIELGNKSA